MAKKIDWGIFFIFLVVGLVLGVLFYAFTMPTRAQIQLESGKVQWTEINPPPNSGFSRCWATLFGPIEPGASDRAQSVAIVCK